MLGWCAGINVAQIVILAPLFVFCWYMRQWETQDLVPIRPMEGEELPANMVRSGCTPDPVQPPCCSTAVSVVVRVFFAGVRRTHAWKLLLWIMLGLCHDKRMSACSAIVPSCIPCWLQIKLVWGPSVCRDGRLDPLTVTAACAGRRAPAAELHRRLPAAARGAPAAAGRHPRPAPAVAACTAQPRRSQGQWEGISTGNSGGDPHRYCSRGTVSA